MAPSYSRRGRSWITLVVFACAAGTYVLTAYPTITWWDSSQYSLAAVTMGITPPPGSFLLTILGWLVTRLPFGLMPGFALNALAGVIAAASVCVVLMIVLRLMGGDTKGAQPGVRGADRAAAAGAALGALALAWSRTFWEYATQFTPYILTTVVTGLIVWTMIRWWETADRPDAWRRLLLLGILFGLDFSVHRTNLLLLPGLFAWILLRNPRTLLSLRAWIAGAGGMAAGLAFHLLIIPIAAGGPLLNGGDPSNWSRFYDYVSLKQQGGGWLVKFIPRNGPFWSTQVMDLVRAFRDTFFWLGGALRVLGLLPALFGVAGAVVLWMRNRRLAVALVTLLFVHTVVTILYFNIPAGFFRSLYRHYLPVFVIFAVFIAYGMGTILRAAWSSMANRRRYVAVVAGLLFAFVPAAQVLHNWDAVDASAMYFTEDFAANTLGGLPDNAILFTNGDNDTWPLWFMQAAHGLRPDVAVLNLPLMNTTWFIDQIVAHDPAFPLSFTEEFRHELRVRRWSDTTISLAVAGLPSRFDLPDSVSLPGSIRIDAAPTINGQYALVQDQILLDILTTNLWKRPICFAVTVEPQNRAWVAPFCRLDGLHWQVVPYPNPPVNPAVLNHNLFTRYEYRGYAEPDIRLDGVSRMIGTNYYAALLTLAHAQFQGGDSSACAQSRTKLESLLPLTRLELPEELQKAIAALCEPDSAPAAE